MNEKIKLDSELYLSLQGKLLVSVLGGTYENRNVCPYVIDLKYLLNE